MRTVVFTWLMLYTLVGSVNAQGIDQIFTGNKPLIFGQVVKNTFNLSHYNKSYAVVVGISQYSGGFSNLLSARKDAERMKNFLINEAGFDYVHLLTEEKVTARRLQQIMVDEIPREVKKNDRFLFYWSGHGESVTRNNNTIGYLPFRQSRVGKFGEMLRMTSLKQWDEGLEAKQTLYLLDACFSGLAGFDVKSNVGDQTLKQMAKPSRQILTAGLPHEKTIAGAKFNGSLFTTAVIDGLRGDADLSSRRHPKDGIISMSELALSVSQRISEELNSDPSLRGMSITPSLQKLTPRSYGDFFFISNEKRPNNKSGGSNGNVITASVSNKGGSAFAPVNKGSVSHSHPANEYSNAVTHSHPGGGVSHPHNYGNRPKLVKPQVTAVRSSGARQRFEPEMVDIPAGQFIMGCDPARDNVAGGCYDWEKPTHRVTISAFQMGKTEVTFEQWDACTTAGACIKAKNEGWGRGKRPVINVSWNDIQTYINWLNQQTGKRYHLPSEAQWEYAARANRNTAFPWGSAINCNNANYGSVSDECKTDRTKPVASYPANAFGLYDTAGNVWEWTLDCWQDSHKGASANGVARSCSESGAPSVIRGGSWIDFGRLCRSAYRDLYPPDNRYNNIGFRLARGH